MGNITITVVVIIIIILFLSGIRIVRPTHRGLIERLGKYRRFAEPGFNYIIPVIEKMYRVNITEKMINAEPQEIITKTRKRYIEALERITGQGLE